MSLGVDSGQYKKLQVIIDYRLPVTNGSQRQSEHQHDKQIPKSGPLGAAPGGTSCIHNEEMVQLGRAEETRTRGGVGKYPPRV